MTKRDVSMIPCFGEHPADADSFLSIVTGAAAACGAVNVAGWNLLLPSAAVIWLWRASALLATGVPPLLVAMEYLGITNRGEACSQLRVQS
ncbi:hypothetical protein BAUCODRAFT_37078 [Baudoinia panamericana UAMH 10762]|uniref:Amino acid permease/ SLC12A domain-containing protein n=1 Tax=Baudoinia panamericana (strain UAMH 10762) TaxID=717646 RepID=M2N3U6_BAUPA|nr:uncharacterized protein BAUCODRAFT_37078 [Baudoinia panamericana UAMH 10762]EMC93390.1 hypothetical protein BAUCODRAFT_37078 [Baudoinia panamericana UAMH 10762]